MTSVADNKPSNSQLRHFGWASALAVALVSWRSNSAVTTLPLRVLAGVLFSVATVWPGVLRRPFLLFDFLTLPLRRVVGWLLLAFVYFLLLSPLALIKRLFDRDTLAKKPDPVADSYWRTRPSEPDPQTYFRQF
jgi:hypothetical protein